jgi:hypothetical protein
MGSGKAEPGAALARAQGSVSARSRLCVLGLGVSPGVGLGFSEVEEVSGLATRAPSW